MRRAVYTRIQQESASRRNIMPSPFPGMDPYLEYFWRDVHTALTVYIRDQLCEQLPEGLAARTEEHVILETTEGREQKYVPDVQVSVDRVSDGFETYGSTAVAEPVDVEMELDEPETERSVQIVENKGGKLVTAIEILSPSNKELAGLERYMDKQRDLLAAGAHMVEVDVILQGRHAIRAPLRLITSRHKAHYYICVSPATDRRHISLYPFNLPDPIPAVAIPLRPDDEDIVLDVQPLLDKCYRMGGYDRTIDYNAEPPVFLNSKVAKWMDEMLKEAGRRSPT
jgi:translation initiation factor 1 (eIF-1/SUI1)